MKILAELTEKSLGISEVTEVIGGVYKLRKSARGIIVNDKNELAVQHIQKYNYHKLPGGGMEIGESIEQTLAREILEEVGATCENITPIGVVIEYHPEFLHISYCFAAKIVGPLQSIQLETDEIENEQVTVWMKPEELLELLKNETVTNQSGLYMTNREMAFLTEYLRTK